MLKTLDELTYQPPREALFQTLRPQPYYMWDKSSVKVEIRKERSRNSMHWNCTEIYNHLTTNLKLNASNIIEEKTSKTKTALLSKILLKPSLFSSKSVKVIRSIYTCMPEKHWRYTIKASSSVVLGEKLSKLTFLLGCWIFTLSCRMQTFILLKIKNCTKI